MYLFYQSVDIPLAKTEIHPHEIEGNGIGSSLPLYKSKDHHECRKKIPFRNKKKRESLSILGVYTAAFFFSQEKLLMLKLAKEQGAPSLLIVPFFVAARSNACETFLFEETYSFIIFKDSFILHYKERIPAR